MGKAKYLSAFERGIIAGAPVCVKNNNADYGFFTISSFPCASRMVHHPKDIRANLTTVGSIGVNMGQHHCGTLSTPSRVHALTN
jgi:hypothetical protein